MRPLRFGTTLDWRRSVGELSLIVIGVLIALGANSWWEGRKDRERVRAYLQQLLSDVRENEGRLKDAIEGTTESLESVALFLDDAFAVRPPPPADSFMTHMRLSSSNFDPLIGTYTALLQSGDIRLLRSDRLRFQVVAYAAEMAATHERLRDTESVMLRNAERILSAWRRIHPLPPAEGPGASLVGRPERVDVDAVLRDPELVSGMEMQHIAARLRLSYFRGLEQPTRALRCLLEAALEPIEIVDVEPASASVGIARTTEFEAVVHFPAGLALERCPVAWASDDEGVASVDDDGKVTGIAAGDATITATFQGVSGSAHVSVGGPGPVSPR